MRLQTVFRTLLFTGAGTLLLTSSALARTVKPFDPTCTFTVVDKTWTLNGDCTTDVSIIVPDGITLDGAGHKITAVDPAGDHFKGGVVQSGGAVAHVTNLRITTDSLADVADAGADRLRGILFDGASGSITNNEVFNVNQGASGSQEGNAIEVRNFGSSPTTIHVTIDGNTVTGYQKTGIVVNGDAQATVTDNEVNGGGPVDYIARNGIQLGAGASGIVKSNRVSGNSYTGDSTYSGGILIVGGEFGYPIGFLPFCVGVQIVQNTLTGNDVGVIVQEYDPGFWGAASTATNVKVVNNIIRNDGLNNPIYQAGIADIGNNDKLINNKISGSGYAIKIDADPSSTNRPKVHANK